MNFSLTAEQELFRDTLRKFLIDRYGFAARRAAARTPLAMRPEIWSAFAQELGILNLSFPERVGGLGADPIGVMIAMEEFGRALLIEPFLETVVICGSLLSQLGGSRANEALIRIGKGELRLALASAEAHACPGHLDLRTTAKRGAKGWQINGAKSVVMGAPWASQLLVTARTTGRDGDREGVSLFLVDRRAGCRDAMLSDDRWTARSGRVIHRRARAAGWARRRGGAGIGSRRTCLRHCDHRVGCRSRWSRLNFARGYGRLRQATQAVWAANRRFPSSSTSHGGHVHADGDGAFGDVSWRIEAAGLGVGTRPGGLRGKSNRQFGVPLCGSKCHPAAWGHGYDR